MTANGKVISVGTRDKTQIKFLILVIKFLNQIMALGIFFSNLAAYSYWRLFSIVKKYSRIQVINLWFGTLF